MLHNVTTQFYTKVYVLAGVDVGIYSIIFGKMYYEYTSLKNNFPYTFMRVHDLFQYGYIRVGETGHVYFTDKFIDEVINAI